MIAPLREPEHWTDGPSGALRQARRVVAETFLPPASEGPRSAPRVAAWKAWLFAGWTVFVVAAWFRYMFLG
jgi:hypothetical protein